MSLSRMSKQLVAVFLILLMALSPEFVGAQTGPARQTARCSVEIRVLTPNSLVLSSDEGLCTTYRVDSVEARWIQISKSPYNEQERHYLIAGELNQFDLALEVAHDFYAFDSLHLSFGPIIMDSESGMKTKRFAGGDVRVGRFPVDLMRENYKEKALAKIIFGSGESTRTLAVLEAKPRWQKLHKDLAANPGRRRLTKIIEYSAIAGTVISALWAWKSDSDARDRYEEYLLQVQPEDVSGSYSRYEDMIEKRNILGTVAITLAATGIVSFLSKPRNEYELVADYERKYGPSGVTLDIGDDHAAIKLTWSF